MTTVYIDFETYSELDLLEVGSWVYSKHPSTEILCFSWRTKDDHGIWISETMPSHYVPLRRLFNKPALTRLFKLIEDRSNTVEAHNAFFEKCIWWNIGEEQLFWPSIEEHQWRCSATKAATCSLPRALGDAGRAMKLPDVKDEVGRRAMMKLAKRTKKGQRPAGTKEEWEALYDYCENDTASEMALSLSLPDLTPRELEIWREDQRMNLRGIPCDVTGANRAIALIDLWTDALNEELVKITDKQVTAATQRGRILAWLQDNGCSMQDTKANTFDHALENMEEGNPRRVVEIVRSIGRSSTAKYKTLIESSDEGLMRDTQMYHGARTGRWTAKRFQPQNLVRGDIKKMEFVWDSVIHLGGNISETLELIQILFGDPMEFLSHAMRGVIKAEEGQQIYSADYSAVETRVLFWIAEEKRGLEILHRGEDIYLDQASLIFGRPITKEEYEARQLGKHSILGLGFQMGFTRFLVMCRQFKMKFSKEFVMSVVPAHRIQEIAMWIKEPDRWKRCRSMGMNPTDLPELVLMKFIVDRYHDRYNATVGKLWRDVQNAAFSAAQIPNKSFAAGKCVWLFDGEKFLTCTLPSGRKLYYLYPEMEDGQLTYWGVDAKTHQWVPMRAYGGILVENTVQAIARDLMAEAFVRCSRTQYKPIMLVHDEVVSQAANGNLKEYISIIMQSPVWAVGLPIKAEGWVGNRYRK